MKIRLPILLVVVLFAGCARQPQLQTPISSEVNYPQQVAIMLPLHGSLAGNGQATLNGFLAAYYDYLQHEPLNVSLDIVDTSQGSVRVLYKQAVKNGAIFVVGPLTKQNVHALAHHSLSVPTLALNTVDNYQKLNVDYLYQFGLSSEDELKQVASKAWVEHPGRALLIAPNSVWGRNATKTLQTSWETAGGKIATTLLYKDGDDLDTRVKQALNVDISQANAKQLAQILRQDLKYNPRRRQDINAIFLIAPPPQARQIRPLLAFYFAGNIPTYSTSLVYYGIPRPSADRDLEGVIFCDMPWTIQDSWTLSDTLSNLHNQVIQYWPESYKNYNRFYALGIDSFYLMLKLNVLATNPQQGIAGATGTLYMDQYRHIYRQLEWAKMRDGTPLLLS